MPAIRIQGLGLRVLPPLETDGVNRPREAWRSLMTIAGVNAGARGEPTVTYATDVLRDVSLEIPRGSVVCLLPPGDESSALLQMLAGVTPPTAGRIEIFGALRTLLNVGDNYDARSTAYENLVALPELAGAPPEEVARVVGEILDFAELHGFEHLAIRTFSTGMAMRLSVALALWGRPEIVLLDDVLAVGDIGFQQKCVERVHALKEAGATLVLAFSDERLVRRIATRVLSLAGGRVTGDSDPAALAALDVRQTGDAEWQIRQALPENDTIALRAIAVEPGRDSAGAFIHLRGAFETKRPGIRCRPVVGVSSPRGVLFRSVYPEFVALPQPGPVAFTVRVPTDVLPGGTYSVGFHMASIDGEHVHALKATEAVSLTIRRETPARADDAPVPVLTLPFRWDVSEVAEAVIQ
jgi:lipopolysaccharide transport system ATP-binding protein